jgi:hypothetical protein
MSGALVFVGGLQRVCDRKLHPTAIRVVHVECPFLLISGLQVSSIAERLIEGEAAAANPERFTVTVELVRTLTVMLD